MTNTWNNARSKDLALISTLETKATDTLTSLPPHSPSFLSPLPPYSFPPPSSSSPSPPLPSPPLPSPPPRSREEGLGLLIVFGRLPFSSHLDGYAIPKGTTVAMFPTALHWNPDVWPDPMKFDPDRFLPENADGRHPFAYIPFSGGIRNCIGERIRHHCTKNCPQRIIRAVLNREIKQGTTTAT